jgi:hypothetical protein
VCSYRKKNIKVGQEKEDKVVSDIKIQDFSYNLKLTWTCSYKKILYMIWNREYFKDLKKIVLHYANS